MIKKILIIIVLTFSILFSSFYVQQRKAEAILPFILYVAAGLVINYLVGRFIYKSVGQDIYIAKMMNYDPSTGTVGFEWNENSYTGQREVIRFSSSGKNVYPENGAWEENPFGLSLGGTIVDSVDFQEYQGSIISDADLVAVCDNWGDVDYCTIKEGTNIEGEHAKSIVGYATDGVWGNINDDTLINNPPLVYDSNIGGMGGVYSGTIDDLELDFYEFIEDVPLLPNCFDGIQNQDETGIDCGGVCEINFGFVCPPPPETCFDGIMNQDETGIDYGGVCGIGGEPAPAGPEPTNFTDSNADGIDDLSGYDSTGNVPIGAPGDADGSTYDSSLPGDISEVGETDWTGLITGYLSTNPLVLLATGSSISLSGETCTLTANVFGTDVVIDFCPMESMINLIGTFVLGLMAIRSVFIAMGI